MPVQPCDKAVYTKGALALSASTGPVGGNALFDEWVRKVATRSEQPVDWHYIGGRAVVKHLGDAAKVQAAITDLIPELPPQAMVLRRWGL